MQDLVRDIGQHLGELAELAARGRGGHAQAAVRGLVRGDVVVPGADAADAVDDTRDFLDRSAHDKLLETTQRHDLHTSIGDVAVGVEMNLEPGMAFDARDGRNADGFSDVSFSHMNAS